MLAVRNKYISDRRQVFASEKTSARPRPQTRHGAINGVGPCKIVDLLRYKHGCNCVGELVRKQTRAPNARNSTGISSDKSPVSTTSGVVRADRQKLAHLWRTTPQAGMRNLSHGPRGQCMSRTPHVPTQPSSDHRTPLPTTWLQLPHGNRRRLRSIHTLHPSTQRWLVTSVTSRSLSQNFELHAKPGPKLLPCRSDLSFLIMVGNAFQRHPATARLHTSREDLVFSFDRCWLHSASVRDRTAVQSELGELFRSFKHLGERFFLALVSTRAGPPS